MSVIGNILIVAALVSTSAALAAPSHLTDSQYIAAARCQGLFDSRALGSSDASVIDKVVKDEGATRTPDVFLRADDARSNAGREARNASPTSRSALAAERDGACQAYTGGFAPHAAN
ncbi:MAG TPA: hypothetical protein VG166_14360 [Caulobacteraceae bacterium]|jgi:hypothetical protein|nr:hypothetical protein [Caulobacteraceae bacterium]